MSFEIQAAMPCLDCGAPGVVSHVYHDTFEATRSRCYGPDRGRRRHQPDARARQERPRRRRRVGRTGSMEELGVEHWPSQLAGHIRAEFQASRRAGMQRLQDRIRARAPVMGSGTGPKRPRRRVSLSLRCSALPLAFLCGGSVRGGELAINPTNAPAELGSGVHECLRTLPRTGQADWMPCPRWLAGMA
jgi:hypothetical protein